MNPELVSGTVGIPFSAPVLGILSESSIRILAVVTIVSAILFVMRIRSNALRHRVWTGVLVAMLMMPLLASIAPPVGVPFLPVRRWFPEPIPAPVNVPPSGQAAERVDVHPPSVPSTSPRERAAQPTAAVRL